MTIASDFTTDAVISYSSGPNGTYTFGPAANILKVSHKPIPSQDKRTVIATSHTFIIEDVLQATDQLDGTKVNTTKIRQQLLVPGGQFVCSGIGLGPFAVNASILGALNVGPRDCMWGPIPTMLTWENYGNGKAGKIVWQMECCTPEQCADPASTRQVMDYSYEADFSKDSSGYSRRVISGKIVIPMTRKSPNDRTIPDSVDRLRESCYPDVPIGWKRTSDDWKVSADRRTATFNYVDEEQPPISPAKGVVSCEETHSAETADNNLLSWTTTLTGTYEMTRAQHRADSWLHFTKFCKSRIDAIVAKAGKDDKGSTLYPIPIKLRISEPIHSRTSGEFSLTLAYILNAQGFSDVLVQAISGSGLWTPLLENDYKEWKKSMSDDGVFSARGPAKTSLPTTNEVIIDLCLNQPTIAAKGPFVQVSDAGASRDRPTITLAAPPQGQSFLAYEFGIRVEDVDSVVELKPLPTQPLQYVVQDPGVTGTGGFVDKPYANTPTSVFQDRAGSTIAVTLFGAALRAGYNISPPVLVSVGGLVARRQNRPGNFFQTRLWGNLGIPIVEAIWSQRFILPAPPTGGFGAPANPLYGTVSQGGFRLK